ncbi:hypothetical protein [Reinekea thalattae]|uniref:hypothetical protein n=1 Tax=Reinekea thalattae TaxID=2593301 RepID=UPI00164F59D4|nr:hypothetical protein [Reinekea thalattae]
MSRLNYSWTMLNKKLLALAVSQLYWLKNARLVWRDFFLPAGKGKSQLFIDLF